MNYPFYGRFLQFPVSPSTCRGDKALGDGQEERESAILLWIATRGCMPPQQAKYVEPLAKLNYPKYVTFVALPKTDNYNKLILQRNEEFV